MDTKPIPFAESPGRQLEPARGVTAALEYAGRMRLSLQGETGSAQSPATCVYWKWKRLFDAELAAVREQERMRMALSRDWSGLGRYVENGVLITRHSITLDTAGLLSRWRFAVASRLFETSVAVILDAVLAGRES